MQDNSYKKNIEQQLHDLNMEPSQDVWLAVEKALDKKKRRYFFGWWWLLPLLLIGTGLVWYFNKDTAGVPMLAGGETTSTAPANAPATTTVTSQPGQASQTVMADTGHSTSSLFNNSTINNGAPATVNINASLRNRAGTKRISGIDSSETENAGDKHRRKLSDQQQQKITITAAHATMADSMDEQTAAKVTPANTDLAADSANITAQVEKKEEKKPGVKPDTALIAKKEKKKTASRWEKEWSLAAGISSLANVTSSNRLENVSYTADMNSGINTRVINVYKFKPGAYVQAGINIGRSLSGKISWLSGLHYNYQRVPSENAVYRDSAQSTGSPANYSNPYAIIKGNLHIHSINIPLLLKFSLSKKFDINTGLYNNISFSSNQEDYKNILGRKHTYMPVFHLNPSYRGKHFAVGPFVNIGLQQYSTGQNMINYGLLLKYIPKK